MKKNERRLTAVLLAVYLLVLAWVVLFKASALSAIPGLFDHGRSVNWIPFYYDEETSGHLSEVVWNVILFVPLGVYLKMLGAGCGKAVLCGLGVSVLLEILQFAFGIGVTDVTDVITNTAGTALGVGIYCALRSLFMKTEALDKWLRILAAVCTGGVILLAAVLFWAN
jgi:glycopeptide antibiotics resistance protein